MEQRSRRRYSGGMRRACRNRCAPAAALTIAAGLSGCVPVEMPLRADGGYPSEWPEIRPLDAKCESLGGAYRNEGSLVQQDGSRAVIRLSELLTDTHGGATTTITVQTRPYFRATTTSVDVASDDGRPPQHPTPCVCNQETLLCVAKMTTWTVPMFALGGSQLNVYMTSARDGSLIAKLQRYSAGLVVVAPYFYRKSEPWARFERMEAAPAVSTTAEPEGPP